MSKFDPKNLEKIYHEAMENFRRAVEADEKDRELAYEDLLFYFGDQWPDDVKLLWARKKRSMVTLNRFPAIISQVVNEGRLAKVSPKVLAVDQEADPDTAKTMEALIKHIEYASNGAVAFETALTNSASTGRGAVRICTDYASDDDFVQDIKIERILDPFSVWFDPTAKNYDKSDGRFCFFSEWLGKEEFEELYGEGSTSFDPPDNRGGDFAWTFEGQMRRCEYFIKGTEEKTLYQLQDMTTGEIKNVIQDALPAKVSELASLGIEILNRRKVYETTVYRYILGGGKVLEGPEVFPSKFIPIVPMTGPEVVVNGVKYCWSMIRHAKDAQRSYNYGSSSTLQSVALSPKAPYIATKKQLEGVESIWSNSNVENYAVLPYNADPQAPGRPERALPAPLQPALIQIISQSAEDIKAITGVHDASLGMPGNEISGVAISARQSEGDTATYTWLDNMHRTFESVYRIIVDMIPRIYDTERVIRVTGEGGKVEDLKLNAVNEDVINERREILNNVQIGKYDVRIDIGPATKTQRQENLKIFQVLGQNNPMILSALTIPMLKSMDFEGKDEAIEAVQRLLNPQQPQQDPEAKIDYANKVATLEGKELTNEQKRRDLAVPPQMQRMMQQVNAGG